MITQDKNYYRILQVDPTADPIIIQSAFHILVFQLKKKENYSSKLPSLEEIHEAYAVLKDPAKREQYDCENFFKKQKNTIKNNIFQLRCFFCNSINEINLDTQSDKIQELACRHCKKPFSTLINNQRRFPRYSCKKKVIVSQPDSEEMYEGTCVNFSRSGMLLEIPDKKFEEKERLKISFTKNNHIFMIGIVVRVQKSVRDESFIYTHGIEFTQTHHAE
ncbi:MAG: hypothetical protein C4541_03875 [Candidatus Auribacter fodinae]|jgi:DnaJ-class molecular chaperone|uniref:J domain-containing protein n=1 Tax=Candidatus Auribacter fodinae TaxID=2093366 RepID=A0A3A4R783_9BACT|nr:MAG: hypothetical protein C4541_03875 [Candidatus Auribacter fodinae]